MRMEPIYNDGGWRCPLCDEQHRVIERARECIKSHPAKLVDAYRLVTYIAKMADCVTCYPEGPRGPRTGLCSSHRSPVYLTNGFLHGWTQAGGTPNNFKDK